MTVRPYTDALRAPSAGRRFLRALPALGYGLAIFYGGMMDIGPLPNAPVVATDKLLHFTVFMGFEWLVEFALVARSPRARRTLAVAIAAGAGLLLELVQSALPHRSAELLDLAADTLGALAGAVVLTLVARLRPGRAVA